MRRTRLAILLPLTIMTVGLMTSRGDGQQRGLSEDELPRAPEFLQPPPPEFVRSQLQPLSEELPDTSAREGLMPPDAGLGLFGTQAPTWGTDRGNNWVPLTVHWCPSEIRYRPLYFEDVMLERHGQSRHCLIQPLASGSRFFLSVLAIPYKTSVDPPHQMMSTLGHFRPGSGPPLLLQRPPLVADAGLWQAGVVVGLIFLVP